MCSKQFYLPLLATMWLLAGCNRPATTAVELPERPEFRNGDLVLRCGHGLESRAVTFQSGSAYSHIGILQYDSTQGQWLVLHAVPGEAPQGEPEYLKREPIGEFYAYDRATIGAHVRVRCSDSIAREAARYAERKVREHIVFDNDYLLLDTSQFYCSELVWQAYLHQGLDLSDSIRQEVPQTFCREGECIFPSDIANSTNILYVKPFKTITL